MPLTHGPFGGRIGSRSSNFPNTSWETWDEATKTGWGDSANTYIVFMESAAGNETGQGGGLIGADLVATISGNPGAAAGTPPYRAFDGIGDYASFTLACSNLIANGTSTWTIIIKCGELTGAQTANDGIFEFRDAGTTQVLRDIVEGGFRPNFQLEEDNNLRINDFTVDKIPTTGIVHYAIWSDGTYLRCGFIEAAAGSGANGQPTLSSDFLANKRKSYTGSVSYTNGDFDSLRNVFLTNNGTTEMEGNLYYVLFSTSNLIINND